MRKIIIKILEPHSSTREKPRSKQYCHHVNCIDIISQPSRWYCKIYRNIDTHTTNIKRSVNTNDKFLGPLMYTHVIKVTCVHWLDPVNTAEWKMPCLFVLKCTALIPKKVLNNINIFMYVYIYSISRCIMKSNCIF